MPRPRKELIDLSATPYYHVYSRCVRRAYLCGSDPETGVSYEHRKQWLEERMRLLASIFTVTICAYTVMSNHYHIVVHINPEEAQKWTDAEVLVRWRCLYKGSKLTQRHIRNESLSSSELKEVWATISDYRRKLTSLSWFMKALNEPIARMANQEDECSGHFWESRFNSRALRTRAALLACMAYVDLNPVRAGVVSDPNHSPYTSFPRRQSDRFNTIGAINRQIDSSALRAFPIDLKPLMPFSDLQFSCQSNDPPRLPFSTSEYGELIEWTHQHDGKRDKDRNECAKPTLLEHMGISINNWLIQSSFFELLYKIGVYQ